MTHFDLGKCDWRRRLRDGGSGDYLKEELVKGEFVVFTTDLWISIQNITYECVTVHCLTPDWMFESAVLQTRDMAGSALLCSHTAAHSDRCFKHQCH